jgi:uncharacterized protein (DUF362 family)
MAMKSIVDPLVAAMREQLLALRHRYRSQPETEMKHLLLLALEREEIVAVGYRDTMVQRRLARMPLTEEVKEIIRHAMIWIWQDEAMHVVYARGTIVQLKQRLLSMRAALREIQGILGGWSSSLEQHVTFREAPIARSVSRSIVLLGRLTGAVPREVRDYLRLRPFRDYCLFNVAAERTASLVYERMTELAQNELNLPQRTVNTLMRVRDDEYRHEQIFSLMAESLTSDDTLSASWSTERLVESIGKIDPAFLPRRFRQSISGHRHPVGAGGTVVVRSGSSQAEMLQVLEEALEASGIRERVLQRCSALSKRIEDLEVAIKPTFMMSYSHRDPSPAVDADVLRHIGRYLVSLGIKKIKVIESPKVYEAFFQNRDVLSIAREFGFESSDYTVVDCSTDLVEYPFPRGIGETKISRTWKEADFRINVSKLRSHPIERALLTLPNTEGLGHQWTDYLFTEREASYQTAILMIHDEFPADISVLDGYRNAPDGPLGVMGSTSPRHPHRFYVASDPLALDMTAARHMGLADPLESPLLRAAVYWFGDPRIDITVDGPDKAIDGWRGPCHTDLTAFFSLAAEISYQRYSGRGAVFVPQMDPVLFPPFGEPSRMLKVVRACVQRIFGLHLS